MRESRQSGSVEGSRATMIPTPTGVRPRNPDAEAAHAPLGNESEGISPSPSPSFLVCCNAAPLPRACFPKRVATCHLGGSHQPVSTSIRYPGGSHGKGQGAIPRSRSANVGGEEARQLQTGANPRPAQAARHRQSRRSRGQGRRERVALRAERLLGVLRGRHPDDLLQVHELPAGGQRAGARAAGDRARRPDPGRRRGGWPGKNPEVVQREEQAVFLFQLRWV